MIKKFTLAILVFMIVGIMSGCAPARSAAPEYVAPAMAEAAKDAWSGAPQAAAPENNANAADRIVIKNAYLSIVVADPSNAIQEVSRIAEKYKGFVITSNTFKRNNDDGMEITVGEISIRVDAAQLEQAMAEIKALTRDPKSDVKSETIKGEDVTSQYTDLQSRLRNLEQTAAKLEEIMKGAKKTEDVLAVYRELTSINEQIEVLKGQIKYYDEAAKLSSISVDLTSKASDKPLTIGSWQPGGVAKDAVQALINTVKVIGNMAIWVVLYVIPVLIILAIPLFVLYLIFRNRKKKVKTAVVEVPKTETK